MNIAVFGIGWVTREGYGTAGNGSGHRFAAGETIGTTDRSSLFQRLVKNFGRLDDASRLTLAAVSLALRDAALSPSPEDKQSIGIVGTSPTGSLAADREFFSDYLANGRILARANLFIYTLPSSPLGEAAIHFGLTGPLLYLTSGSESFATAVRMAADIIAESGASMMLAGEIRDGEALYFLLGSSGSHPLCLLEDALAVVAAGRGIADTVANLQKIARGNI